LTIVCALKNLQQFEQRTWVKVGLVCQNNPQCEAEHVISFYSAPETDDIKNMAPYQRWLSGTGFLVCVSPALQIFHRYRYDDDLGTFLRTWSTFVGNCTSRSVAFPSHTVSYYSEAASVETRRGANLIVAIVTATTEALCQISALVDAFGGT